MAERLTLTFGDREYAADVLDDGTVTVDGRVLQVTDRRDGRLRISDAVPAVAWSIAEGDTRWVFHDGCVYEFEVRAGTARKKPHHGSLAAPMPATVRKVGVTIGDRVTRGQAVVLLEAMKMELPVRAPGDGVVTAVNCREGELVQPGISLVDIDEA